MGNTSGNKENKAEGGAGRITLGILAHVDAGKTTLSEAILFQTGVIRKCGRVDNQDAFLDTYRLERERGITIFSKQAVFGLGGTTVTLLDTPGHVDFSTEMERTLQVLDYAVLVISGADGVQGHTETLWRLLKRYKIPVFLFINKMDQPGTDRAQLMADIKKRLGDGFVDFGEEREAWLDGLAMCSEELMEAYLETGEIEKDMIRRAVRERKVFPCFFGSALRLTGVEELLKGMEEYAECPKYRPEFGAKVFKISRDGQGNRLTHLKITGGSLKVREPLGGSDGEKVNQIRIYSGAKYEISGEAEAGTVCAVTGPSDTRPGQGFGAEMETGTPFLEPVLTYGLILPDGYDAHKMLANLRELEEEDPMLHILWNEVLSEIQIQVMGDVQIEILKSQIAERFGADVEFGSGSIVYKETIAKAVEGVGHYEPLRHYAEVHLLMEPGDPGSGIQIASECSEDMLDRNWQRLVMTHLEEKPYRGVLTGSEITDMKITLIAGRAHLKHTEGGDFRQATYRAVRQGLKEAGCRLLEPVYQFRLELPAESLGRAMADVERMHGTFGDPVQDGGTAILTGSAPVVTMRGYQREVASYTRGRGRLSCTLKGYEPCHNEAEVIEAIGYDFDADLQDPAGSVFCAHGAGYLVPWNEVKAHMHVESPLGKGRLSGTALDTVSRKEPAVIRPSGETAPGRIQTSYEEDKELEEIFKRTFGEKKRPSFSDGGGRRVIRAGGGAERKQPAKTESGPSEEYLLVDGYNIIFAWEDLRKLAETNIDGARYRLMDILCNYQGFRKCTLIVVFDAYKVTGNTGEALKYHNIHVVYTKEAETADQYIEKLAHKIGPRYRVTVATSDGLEQLIIRGQGCLLMSASDLLEEVERVNKEIAMEKARRTGSGKNYLLSHADGEVAEYLEQVRLGTDGKKKGGRG